MTPQRRNLILMVASGDARCFPYLHQFDRLVHAEHFFNWLVKSGITGKTFVEYYEIKFQYSFKAFAEFIMKRINEDRPLLASDLQ